MAKGDKKYADVMIGFTVEFEDDGKTDLKSQAVDAAVDLLLGEEYSIIEVMGAIRSTPDKVEEQPQEQA